jgi:putative sterol carrier protein
MATSQEISEIFPRMVERFQADKAGDLNATIQFDLSGDNGGLYWVQIANGTCTAGEGAAENPQMTVRSSADDFYALVNGQLNPMQAFMMGKLKVTDMGLGMKMTQIFGL